jgi:hypothetical protein
MVTKDYAPNDEKKILELFRLSFRKELSLDYWNWRFRDNPTKKLMIKLMWDGDTLAGHYAVSPVEMVIDGEVKLTALSMTTMTHPDYAGRGIFSMLAEELYKDIATSHMVSLVWGFPNTNSHYGFIKNLKWKDLSLVSTFCLRLQKFKTTSEKNTISVKTHFEKAHADTAQTFMENFTVKSRRSLKYLNWRYTNNPSADYTIFELRDADKAYFMVTKIFRSFNEPEGFEVDIVELFFPPDANLLSSCIQAIKEHYHGHSILQVNTWIPLSDSRHIHLEKIGFSYGLPLTYLGMRNLDQENISLRENFNNWYFSMGDSDVF